MKPNDSTPSTNPASRISALLAPDGRQEAKTTLDLGAFLATLPRNAVDMIAIAIAADELARRQELSRIRGNDTYDLAEKAERLAVEAWMSAGDAVRDAICEALGVPA